MSADGGIGTQNVFFNKDFADLRRFDNLREFGLILVKYKKHWKVKNKDFADLRRFDNLRESAKSLLKKLILIVKKLICCEVED